MGVGRDVAAMAVALDRWGFTCLANDHADRDTILGSYEKLIADARPGDAIVIYFSGHGSFCVPTGTPAMTWPSSAIQFIVPADYSDDSAKDFRGITAMELSSLQTDLLKKTNNVTVVLDCCHSGHMSRRPEVVVKSWPVPLSYERVEEHLAKLREAGRFPSSSLPRGNAEAVRIVACAPEQLAFEHDNSANERMGRLTDSLTRALHEAKDYRLPLTWFTLVDHVRHDVLTLTPWQRPEAEGPAHRLLFDTEEVNLFAFPVATEGDKLIVRGGRLVGIRKGDEFVIMPAGSPAPEPRNSIGVLQASEVDLVSAKGTLVAHVPGARVPIGARAHHVKAAAPALPVRLPVGDPRFAALAQRISNTPLLSLAADGDVAGAEVRVDDSGRGAVHDSFGPLCEFSLDYAWIELVLRTLKRVARAAALRALSDDIGFGLVTPPETEFGTVLGGVRKRLHASSEILHVGQKVYVSVRNDRRAPEPIYVSLLDIGVASKISPWNTNSASGQLIDPGDEFVFGADAYTGELPGIPLVWSKDLDFRQPRPETLVALITTQRTDARVFEDATTKRVDFRPRSRLERFLAQLDRDGHTRDLEWQEPVGMRFAVRFFDFTLVPD